VVSSRSVRSESQTGHRARGVGPSVPQEVLFVLFGFKITLPLLFTIIAGAFTVGLALYKLIERWLTRNARRLELREYLDREEKDITGRRPTVLNGIRMSEHAYLAEKKLDVGAEIDRAIDLLNRGYPQAAAGKLSELEKRLLTDEPMLRKRADDLRRHTASVRIFLAALADRAGKTDLGLDYIDKALEHDQADLDAMKYKALLQLGKGEHDNAERSFDRLRQRAVGNAKYRADAYLGIATVKFKRGPDYYGEALQSLGNALNNINSVPSAEQDQYTFSQIYTLQGDICRSTDWPGTDKAKALDSYCKAKDALGLIPNKRKSLEATMGEIQTKIDAELKLIEQELVR
jgi:tetratricopeptide (TPR) repeat protein